MQWGKKKKSKRNTKYNGIRKTVSENMIHRHGHVHTKITRYPLLKY